MVGCGGWGVWAAGIKVVFVTGWLSVVGLNCSDGSVLICTFNEDVLHTTSPYNSVIFVDKN